MTHDPSVAEDGDTSPAKLGRTLRVAHSWPEHLVRRPSFFRRPHGGRQLRRVDLLPGKLVASQEIAAPCAAEHRGVSDAGRRRALVAQRPRRLDETPAGARDHLVRWTEMLEPVIRDGAHAFRHRLVLQVDIVDPGIERIAGLRVAIDQPVVRFVGGKAPAAEPVRRIRKIDMVGRPIALPPRNGGRGRAIEADPLCHQR